MKPIGAKIEISSEKRVPVRISRRTKAQSIREGQENATPLGAKLKKNYENFFYDPLQPSKMSRWLESVRPLDNIQLSQTGNFHPVWYQ